MRTPRQFAAIVLVFALLTPGCTNGFMTPPAQPGTTTPTTQSIVGQVAIYGRQFVVAGDGALTGLDLVIGANLIDRQIGVSILTVMKRAGDEAVRLAGVLRVIDNTRDGLQRSSGIQKAAAIVSGIGALFDDSIITINDPRARTIVAAILQTVKALVGDFSKVLASGAPVSYAAEADAFEAFGLHFQSHPALSH
jgi:hypothetical protein